MRLLSFIIILLFLGCAEKNTPTISKYYKNAITINYTATSRLNYFSNEAHSILLVIYQLSNKDIFNEICKNSPYYLLKAEKFDKSVLGIYKAIVYPKQTSKITLDKLEGSYYLGIVAGFYESPKCLIFSLKHKTEYFNSIKFWEPEIYIEGIKLNLILNKDGIRVEK